MFVRLLFLLTVTASVALAATVVLAPWIDAGATAESRWSRIVSLFAGDATVRRTALASSVGLLATAFVFFRSKRPAKAR